jgi:hypothetical protein
MGCSATILKVAKMSKLSAILALHQTLNGRVNKKLRRITENLLFMKLSTILAFHQTAEELSYVAYLIFRGKGVSEGNMQIDQLYGDYTAVGDGYELIQYIIKIKSER